METLLTRIILLTAIAASWTVKGQTGRVPGDPKVIASDHVQILKAPPHLQSTRKVKVMYYCEDDGVVVLEVEVLLPGASSFATIFTRAWRCHAQGFSGQARTKSARYRLPRTMMYRPDYFNRDSVLVIQAKLRVALYSKAAWERHMQGTEIPQVQSRDFQRLAVLPPYSRRYFRPACHTWLYPVLQKSWRHSDSHTCAVEPENVVLLNYPVVFSGFTSGILRTLQPFAHPELQREHLQKYTQPRLSIELWIYVLDYCPLSSYNIKGACGLVIHLDPMGGILTPSLYINDKGQIQVDAVNARAPLGIKTVATLPKHVWTRVVFTLEGRVWHLHAHYGPDLVQAFSIQYIYSEDMHCDDTQGYFSIGGLEPFFGSFVGYVGRAVVYRRRIVSLDQLDRPSPFHPMFELHLTRREEKCRNFLSWLDTAIGVYRRYLDFAKQDRTDACPNTVPKQLKAWSNPASQLCPLKHPHSRKYYRRISRLLRRAMTSFRLSQKFEGGDFEAYARNSEENDSDDDGDGDDHDVGHEGLGRSQNRAAFLNISTGLMEAARAIMTEKGLKKARRMVPLLKQAACLGNDDAMFHLAVMLNNGLGIAADEIQSLAFYMLGSLNRHTLSTMAMGHRHMMGIDGAPCDLDTAFMYYRTAAEKTKEDREQHRDKEVLTEGIRLIDDARMEAQTSEVGDLFVWIRSQAERGVASARTELANMLYWGAQGVQRNLQNALNVYRAGAEEGNAESMFNYGIMQYRGMGGKANVTAGKKMMEKAAELQDSNAISALGWIALTRDGNMSRAHRLFTRAREMEHPDSGYYLGQMHFNGLVPNVSANWDKALEEYEWSALQHHVHAGVMLGFLLTRGTSIFYPRNIALAADWVRFIAEKNSDLAQPLRDAVNAFRDGNTDLSLYLYLIIADTGFEVASFNLAYLCELNQEGVSTYLSKECQWRHYNLTTQRASQFVDPYSYIKMGDFHWYGCQGHRDTAEAARFYSLAALKNDPQALFNLAYMVEEGATIPTAVWEAILVKPHIRNFKYLLLSDLYSRCRESRRSEAFIPCTLALARIHLLQFWHEYYVYMQITSYLGIGIVLLTVLAALLHLVHVAREKRRREREEEEDRRAEEMDRAERERTDGETGVDRGEEV